MKNIQLAHLLKQALSYDILAKSLSSGYYALRARVCYKKYLEQKERQSKQTETYNLILLRDINNNYKKE